MSLSKYDIAAEEGIKVILESEGVAFRNEFRYRLENPQVYQVADIRTIEHTRVDAALKRLEGSKVIIPTAPPGRKVLRRGAHPHVFYRFPGTQYVYLSDVMKRKVYLSRLVLGLSSSAGFYAQDVWLEAFRDLGFDIIDRDVSELDGRRSMLSGDIDFVARRDGLTFGVEVKNRLPYPTDITKKFKIAADLGTIPFFVARRLPSKMMKGINACGGLFKIYETAIYPPELKSLVGEATKTIGYPIIAVNEISQESKNHLDQVARIGVSKRDALLSKLAIFLGRGGQFSFF